MNAFTPAGGRFSKFSDLIDPATRDVIPEIWQQSPMPFAPMEVPIERIISREVHEAEKRDLWSRVWQFACREEHIPNVGDQYVYEICDKSYLIVRSAPDRVQAFVNACLHRGRALRDYPGNAEEIKCPYHSFTWTLDGRIKSIPCWREFAGRSRDQWSLPEVKVDTWEGFVFINPDVDAPPLRDFLGALPQHFARWGLRDRAVTMHIGKLIRCNWKLAQEAFMEAFHVSTTHPQSLLGTAGEQSQYDAFGNFSRAMTSNAVPSAVVTWSPSEQEMLDAVVERTLDMPIELKVAEGQTARQVIADGQRSRLRSVIGDDVDRFVETELVDLFYYTLFPNFHPWGAFNEVAYRFRPWGDNHRESLMEVMFLTPFRAGRRPPPAPMTLIGFDDAVADVPQVGALGRVFDQDMFNLPRVQQGLEAAAKKTVTLSAYQEIKIRHFYELHEQWVG